jgi:hypothetical protein
LSPTRAANKTRPGHGAARPPAAVESGAGGAAQLSEEIRTQLADVAGEGGRLDLHGRKLGAEGAAELAAALQSVSDPVIQLDLSNCGLGDAGVVALLQQDTPCLSGLKHLDLSHNHIGEF